jgi:hypothetical protein
MILELATLMGVEKMLLLCRYTNNTRQFEDDAMFCLLRRASETLVEKVYEFLHTCSYLSDQQILRFSQIIVKNIFIQLKY